MLHVVKMFKTSKYWKFFILKWRLKLKNKTDSLKNAILKLWKIMKPSPIFCTCL